MSNEKLTTIMGMNGASNTLTLPGYVLSETANGSQPIPIDASAYANGIIYLTGEINNTLAHRIILLLLLAAQEKKKLMIFINSPGGSVSAGLTIYDAIKAYPYEIYTCCAGLAASMGAVLLAAAKKGCRLILPHSKVMIHEPLIAEGLGGSATSIQRTAESILATKKILNGLLAESTGRTLEEIDQSTAFDNYFNAEEAISFGLCDRIATGYECLTDISF